MTFRLDVGCDPGMSGALAVLADGQFDEVYDLPIRERKSGGNELDGRALAAIIRDILRKHPGASVMVAREHVQPMPSKEGGRSMGASSAFYYGCGVGKIDGVLETLNMPMMLVHASRWKPRLDLKGKPKDYARTAAMERHPASAPYLKRKKDGGRADAILIATWLNITEQLPEVASREPVNAAGAHIMAMALP